MLKSFKYRIYPKKEQTEAINKHFGCVRWVYNWGLQQKISAYQIDKKNISRFDLQKQLPVLKKQENTKWLSEVNAQSLQIALDHLDKSFVRFFKLKKGFPKFKSKHNNRQSYQCFNGVKVDFGTQTITLPKIKHIKTVFSQPFEGTIKTSTISKTPTGKYFISILVLTSDTIIPLEEVDESKSIGIDTGIKQFLTLSNGEVFQNNTYLKSSLKRLKCLSKRVSRKKKGSNNRKKAVKKLALIHEKITNQRLDYIHKVTSKLTTDNQISSICIEDLNIAGMVKNHKLSQALSDVSIGKFYEILTYKCKNKGINLFTIGRFDASSKTCSCCGKVKHDLTLNDRVYKCDSCGLVIDRDLNASKNILTWGLNPKNISGVGSSVGLVEVLAVARPMKQEKVKPINR